MRHAPQIEWEVLEAEDDEWAEVTLTATAGERRPVRWQRLATALGGVALLIALAGLAGYRLWQDAEAGITATERHIGTLVQVETIRQQQSEPAGELAADVQSVDIKGSTAMVQVVITETSPLGEACPRTEMLFYRRYPAGWKRTEPVAAFWGRAATLDTATLHFDFYELDRPFVEAVAEPADSFYRTVRQFLGLPPWSATEQVTITVAPRNVALAILADGTLLNSSPLMRNCYGGCERATMLLMGLRTQLIMRSLEESRAYYHLVPVWEPMYSFLSSWLIGHADELPAVVTGGTPIHQDVGSVRRTYLLRSPVVDNASAYYPGYAEYRSAYAADKFYDALMAERGPAAIPALLAALGTEDRWPEVVQAAFGLSVVELQAEWNAYLKSLWQKTPEPAPADQSVLTR